MSEEFSNVFKGIDTLVRASQLDTAKNALLQLKRAAFNSEEVLQYSSLCCRAGIPELAVLKLRPIVQPTGRKTLVKKPEHIIEFALCLIRLGACREAENILRELSPKTFPETNRIWGLLHLREWNYHLAIPCFKEHIASVPTGSYPSTVSKMNLCMALVFEEQFNEAASILNEIITHQENFQFGLVKANCYRLYGGLELNRGNYEVAMSCFQKSLLIFGEPDGVDAFSSRKWIGITQYFMQKGDPVAKVFLESLRQEAIARRQWESVRDIDYQVASFHKDEMQLIKLYFGTSYTRFKERILKRFPSLKIPKSYTWQLKAGSLKKPTCFELETSVFKPGQSSHRMMAILLSDFYRSFTTVDLFRGIYPEEIYSFGSSEQKVYQISTRLRTTIKKNKLPFIIQCIDGDFKLVSDTPISIIIQQDTCTLQSPTDYRVEQLLKTFENRPFSVLEVVTKLEVSRSGANQVLTDCLQRDLIVRIGKGKNTCYQAKNAATHQVKKAA